MTLRLPKRMRKNKGLPQGVSLLDHIDTRRMEALFGKAPAIKVAPYSEEVIGLNELRLWCVRNAVYQVPTQELIDFLADLICGRGKAIEICSGNGAVGRALGIPRTDSYLQERAEIQALYQRMRQPIVRPPEDVERLEALKAIEQHEPEVVVGCFCTQLGTPDITHSSPYGVDERKLLRKVKRYIMVGNEDVHGKKLIMPKLTKKYGPFPWLVSRAQRQGRNFIYVWDT